MGDIKGAKTCLITGASAGIGKEMARQIARSGATVVMVSRSRDRLASAEEEIKREVPAAKTDLLVADLSSQAEIRRLASEFISRYNRLDILINNAGVLMANRSLTDDGIETTLAVNHLGYFLLTNLLLETIKASSPARIVNVSSSAHKSATLDFEDLQNEKRYVGFFVYCESKLANVLFTYELARRLEGTGVTANCFHPGAIATELFRDQNVLVRLGTQLFLKTPARGAKTGVYLATSPEVEGVTGKYFVNKHPARSNKQSHDEAAAQRLWEISAELTGLSKPMTALPAETRRSE
ncbi:MAG TPA: SDR family oxidoreductase [Blastocatellia bacterium]|nr:SDR family oxidoreductase [Blastocatellia bacterium]